MALTITEALAEIKTLVKRIEKKRESVKTPGYLFRQDRMKDPLEKDGGSAAFIAAELQSVRDLEERIISLRRAITHANATTEITIEGTTRTIADWLTWRRELAEQQGQFLGHIIASLAHIRQEAMKKGVGVNAAGETTRPEDIVVTVKETDLTAEYERLSKILGMLDGQLSLKNATVTVE